ncbi:MAG: hypothetical protein ACXVIY_05765 [Mucilaginibacter sp.]
MVLLVYIALMISSAFAVASGIYYVVKNRLVKAGNKEPQVMGLLASLFSFGITLSIIYFALLQQVVVGM